MAKTVIELRADSSDLLQYIGRESISRMRRAGIEKTKPPMNNDNKKKSTYSLSCTKSDTPGNLVFNNVCAPA